MTRLSPAMRLVIRIGSGLLVAAVIAIALTVPAPAFNDRCHDHDSPPGHGYLPSPSLPPQAHGGDTRCGLTMLDFSHDRVDDATERPRGLVSHDLAAIKGHGRYQFLRDMPPSPPPHAG
jgi:hypothetical protein